MAYVIVHHQPGDGNRSWSKFSARDQNAGSAGGRWEESGEKPTTYVVPSRESRFNHGQRYLPAFRLWSNRQAGPRTYPFPEILADDRQKNGDRGHPGQDSIPMGRPALKSDKEAAGYVFAQKFQTAESLTCRKVPWKTGWRRPTLSPPEIAAQTGTLGEERARFNDRKPGSVNWIAVV